MKRSIPSVVVLAAVASLLIHYGSAAVGQGSPSGESGQASSSLEAFAFVDEPNCVIAKELLGEWIPDDDITRLIDGKASYDFFGFRDRIAKIAISLAPHKKQELKQCLEWAAREIADRRSDITKLDDARKELEARRLDDVANAMQNLYLCGEVAVHSLEGDSLVFPFVLTTMWGNHSILLFKNENNEISKKGIVFSLVRDSGGLKDLLFIGGENISDPMLGFKRPVVDNNDR